MATTCKVVPNLKVSVEEVNNLMQFYLILTKSLNLQKSYIKNEKGAIFLNTV